jgi:hypothetical protein
MRRAGNGIGHAGITVQVLQHDQQAVEKRDHLRTCIRDSIEDSPLADETECPVARPDRMSALKSIELRMHLSMRIDKTLFLTIGTGVAAVRPGARRKAW